MDLLQAAVKTFDANADLVGVLRDGDREPLCPIAHYILKSSIEIELDEFGGFVSASKVEEANCKIILPCTEPSATRTSNVAAHPLCDRLEYLVSMTVKEEKDGKVVYRDTAEKHADFLEVLGAWVSSAHATPLINAVYAYIKGGTILKDLADNDIIKLDENGMCDTGSINGSKYSDCLVRWVVNGEKCWEDKSLFSAWQEYYLEKKSHDIRGVCMITGETNVPIALAYDKGILQGDVNGKIVSETRVPGFTFRGRVANAEQVFTMGYENAQKAYKALRWIASNQGVAFGIGKTSAAARTYLVWNPDGNTIVLPFGDLLKTDDPVLHTPTNYKFDVQSTIRGYRMSLPDDDCVIFASLEATSKGRLSVVSYGYLTASEYYDRLQNWYETLCWEDLYYGVSTPSLKRIVTYAYGTPKTEDGNTQMRLSEGLEKSQMSEMADSLLNGSQLPATTVSAITNKASQLFLYDSRAREKLLTTACAVIRKYLNDKHQWEEWTMVLDETKRDRSYQFGRLLAVFERAELNTYNAKSEREPLALRLQKMFCTQPMHTANILIRDTQCYFQKLKPQRRQMYRDMIDQIMSEIAQFPVGELNRPLGNTYLLGYSLQRLALKNSKKTFSDEEDEEE